MDKFSEETSNLSICEIKPESSDDSLHFRVILVVINLIYRAA